MPHRRPALHACRGRARATFGPDASPAAGGRTVAARRRPRAGWETRDPCRRLPLRPVIEPAVLRPQRAVSGLGVRAGQLKPPADGSPRRPRLRRSNPSLPGYTRIRRDARFEYRDVDGSPLVDPDALLRIQHLAIPPAWRDVWICADPLGH